MIKTGESHSYVRLFSFNFQDVGKLVRNKASQDLAKRAEGWFGSSPKKGDREMKRQLEATSFCYWWSFFFFLNKHLFCVIKFPYFFL